MDTKEPSWDYRVLMFKQATPKNIFGYSIHEVFYDPKGKPASFNSDPLNLTEVTLPDLMKMMDKLLEASRKPILEVKDGRLIELKQVANVRVELSGNQD